MEQETIKAVRQAELDAEQAEKAALLARDEILSGAKANAAKTIARMTSDAKAHAALATEQARKQGETMQAAAMETAKQEIAALHQAAASKNAEVKRLILSELI